MEIKDFIILVILLILLITSLLVFARALSFSLMSIINGWIDRTLELSSIYLLLSLFTSFCFFYFIKNFIYRKKSRTYYILLPLTIIFYSYFLTIFFHGFDAAIGNDVVFKYNHIPQQELLVLCENNLVWVGEKLKQYAKQHNNKYPDYGIVKRIISKGVDEINDKNILIKLRKIKGVIFLVSRSCPYWGEYKYYVNKEKTHFIIYCCHDIHKRANVRYNNPAYDSQRGSLIINNDLTEGDTVVQSDASRWQF